MADLPFQNSISIDQQTGGWDKYVPASLYKRKEMMEYYFSGTIERIIFENPSSFFEILLLDISDTDAEDFDDFEIIVTGTMADIMEGEDYTFWGELVHHPKYGEQLKISRYERAKTLSARACGKYFPAITLKELVSKQPKNRGPLWGQYHWQNFWRPLKN